MSGLQYLFSFSVPDPQRQWWDFCTEVHDELQNKGIDDSKLNLSKSWGFIVDACGERIMSWGSVFRDGNGKRYLIVYDEKERRAVVYELI